ALKLLIFSCCRTREIKRRRRTWRRRTPPPPARRASPFEIEATDEAPPTIATVF
ncbi:hypothetical protein TorRG33x02_339370, partial [Trema orientale]